MNYPVLLNNRYDITAQGLTRDGVVIGDVVMELFHIPAEGRNVYKNYHVRSKGLEGVPVTPKLDSTNELYDWLNANTDNF